MKIDSVTECMYLWIYCHTVWQWSHIIISHTLSQPYRYNVIHSRNWMHNYGRGNQNCLVVWNECFINYFHRSLSVLLHNGLCRVYEGDTSKGEQLLSHNISVLAVDCVHCTRLRIDGHSCIFDGTSSLVSPCYPDHSPLLPQCAHIVYLMSRQLTCYVSGSDRKFARDCSDRKQYANDGRSRDARVNREIQPRWQLPD